VKYAALAAALTLGLPSLAIAAFSFTKVRGYLLSLMVFLPVLGAHGSMNLVSRELYRGPDRGFEITGADLVCGALIIAIVARFHRRIEWFPRNSWWLLLFFLNACLLGLAAPELLFTAFSLWKCIRIYCLYWCTVNCLRLGIHRKYVWYGYAGSAAVLTVLAIWQKYLYGVYRIYGPFDHSNTVPLYANLILPALLIWALCDKSFPLRRVVLSIVLCLGLLFAVVGTFSRAGIALAVACFIGAMVWANLRAGSTWVRTASLLLALLFILGGIRAAGPILDRIRSAPAASGAARDEFNYAAELMLRDHPFGVGLNNFSYVLTNQEKYRAHFEAMKYEEQAGVCHHIYWLTAAETGYLGLLLYLVLMARFTWIALRGSFRGKSVERTLLFGIFLGFCALHASGFYEWAFRVTPVLQLFAISAAMAVAWSEEASRRPALPARQASAEYASQGIPA
jgi:hypothetical protein